MLTSIGPVKQISSTYVHASRLTVERACEAWLRSKHALKPSTLRAHRVSLGPLRDELGHAEVQRLTKADIDGLLGRLRGGGRRPQELVGTVSELHAVSVLGGP